MMFWQHKAKEIHLDSNGTLMQSSELLSLVQSLVEQKEPVKILIRFPNYSNEISCIDLVQNAHLTLKQTAEMCTRFLEHTPHSLEISSHEKRL